MKHGENKQAFSETIKKKPLEPSELLVRQVGTHPFLAMLHKSIIIINVKFEVYYEFRLLKIMSGVIIMCPLNNILILRSRVLKCQFSIDIQSHFY